MGTCIRLKSVFHRISYTYYSLRLGVISHVRRCNRTKVHACVCVFNSMCVLESATDRHTPTEIWCVVYDFSCESWCILSFPGVSGRDMRTAATPTPNQPGPPKAPPSPARFPPETVSAAPKNRCRIHARAEQTRPLTGARVMVASSVQLTVGSMWFDGSLVFITEVVGLLDVPRFRRKEVLLLDYNFLHSYSGGVQEQWKHASSVITWPTSHYHRATPNSLHSTPSVPKYY